MSNLNRNEITEDLLLKSISKKSQNEIENEDDENIIVNYEYEIIDEEEKEKEENNSTNKTLGKGDQTNNDILTDKNIDKTIFSKIAEDMYNKIKLNNNKSYNYEDFTNDQFLAFYSDKINNFENNQIIKNFLDRNKQYIIDKNNNKETINNRIDQIQYFNNKKYSQNQIEEKIKQFNDKQELYQNKKKKNIEELSKKIYEEKKKNYQDKPNINKTNLDYLKKKVEYKFRKRNLSQNNKNNTSFNNNNSVNITPKKKMSDKEINNLVNKLHNEAKELKLKISKSSDDFYKKKKKNYNFTNKTSNKILFNNLLKQYQKEIKNIKSVSYIKNPIINFDEFKIILEHMHFINEDTEKNIIKEIWKELTLFSPSNKKDSDLILIYILCLDNLYKNDIEDIIHKNLKWINFKKYDKLIKKRKDLENKYKELRQNRNEYYNNLRVQKEKENLEKKYNSLEYENQHISKSLDKYYESINLKRKKLSETYNIILQKRRNKIEELKDEKEKKTLKECTFKPKTNKNKIIFYSPNEKVNYSKEKKIKKNISEKEKSYGTTYHNTISSLNEKMFNENPISNDYNVQQEIYRYKQARYLKNKKNKELNIRNNFSYNNQIQKEMFFDNEKLNNKETFDKFHKINQNYLKKEPLITFEIQIRNKTDILNYYQGDDVEKIVMKFVKKHNLSNESKRQIKEALQRKIELL